MGYIGVMSSEGKKLDKYRQTGTFGAFDVEDR